MPLSSALMRLLILLCALGMALLAAFFLRGRQLTPMSYLGWGLLAILLPYLGPFLVILYRPGQPLRPRRRLSRRCTLPFRAEKLGRWLSDSLHRQRLRNS